MLTASVETIAAVCSGTVLIGSGETIGNGLVIDSRDVEPGAIFIALSGERADGHSYLMKALEEGARVLIVTRDRDELVSVLVRASDVGAAVIRVEDGVKALQDLASWHRGRLHAVVIGITGSTGKTTTKDFLTAVLSSSMRVVSTVGNRNNELGLPLTIVRAGSDTDALVLEMGMRGLGQIARLAQIARPDFGLVTNVGTSHIEILGTRDAVATAKGELVRAIPGSGAVFLNGDDAFSDPLALDSAAPVVRYGLSDHCDVRATQIELDEMSRARFTLETPAGSVRIQLDVPGRHNVYNAAAAAAIGLRMAVPLECIAEALGSAVMSGMRMQTFTTAAGVTVINDAYNANPSSMRAALEALAAMRVPGRRIAVIGDMAELGSLSELAHFQIGEAVSQLGLDALVTIGERARRIGDGAKAEGMKADAVRCYATVEDARELLAELLGEGDAVLVKASRVMGLERVVEGIVQPGAR